MNFKEICKVGLKILVGLAAGVAAVLGINKLGKRKQQPQPKPEENEERVNRREVTKERSISQGNIMNNLNQVYNACSKISGIVQTLSMVIGNLSTIFGPARETQPFGSSYGTFGSPIVDFGNGAWSRRISPHIVEVNTSGMEPMPQGNYYNQGPGYGAQQYYGQPQPMYAEQSIMSQPVQGQGCPQYGPGNPDPNPLFPPDTRRRTSNLKQANYFPQEWKYDENAPCIPEDLNKTSRFIP